MGKKVIIIGSGVGGLSTAVRLLSNGYSVKVYEKEEQIGGKVNLLQTNDFKFDLTASILMTPQDYKNVFEYANKDYNDYLEFIRINPNYRLFYGDRKNLDFHSDIVKLTNTLESISLKDSIGYFKFLSDIYEKYIIANENFLQKSNEHIRHYLSPTSLLKALKLNTFTTSYDYISKYIENEKLREFLAFQCLYVGISPFNGPNIYTLIPAITHYYGLWHLKGGMYSYIQALEKLIYELGGVIETKTNVEEIVISENKAIGIKTENGIEKGDIIVCNADFPYAVKELIKDSNSKGKYSDEYLDNMKYTCSTFIIYLGLNKKYPNLSVHNIYIGDNFKENIEDPFEGKIPDNPPLYIYCPSKIDETMASNNKECLSIIVRVPNLLFDNIRWDENTINTLRQSIFKKLKSIKGLEDIDENIVFESYLTPKNLHSRFNSYGGAAFGLSPTLTQTNYFRPHIKSDTVDNLYFVGSSVHPGSGVSIVLLSSELVTEEILKDN